MTGLNNAWLDTKRAGELLGVGVHQVVCLCQSRRLSGVVKRKGKWLIPVGAISEYKDSRKGKVPIEVGILRRTRSHLLCFLSKLGEDVQTYGTALLELHTQAVLDDYSKEQIRHLEDSITGNSKYIERVWKDLCQIDNELRVTGYGAMSEEGK